MIEQLTICLFKSKLATILRLVAILSVASAAWSESPSKPWEYSAFIDGYLVPGDVSYANPNFMADRKKLHLEARYNYEALQTGSLWIGYNYKHEFGAKKVLKLNLTPMVSGVFGKLSGVAPGCELTLAYKEKLELEFSNEYVFASSRANSFYYAWPQLNYYPVHWLKVGAVAQQTQLYQTKVDVQRGFLVGLIRESGKRTTSFTAYVFNPGVTTPTVVLEAAVEF